MQVVDLGTCRELLSAIDRMRARILRGKVTAVAVSALDTEAGELILFAGEYLHDKPAAAKAAMRMSWELTKELDFRSSRL